MVKCAIYGSLLFSLTLNAQDIDFHLVKKLNAPVNGTCEETMPLVSPDGKKLLFVRVACAENTGGEFAGSDIWVSHWDLNSGAWGKPTNKNSLHNDKNNNVLAGISRDGRTIYMLHTSSSKKVRGVYFSRWIDPVWTKPEIIPLPFLNTEKFLGLYIAPDFDVMIISMTRPDTKGEEDLYVSTRNADETWSVPRNLGPVVNTAGYEISPFLSADKRRLYFSSNGHKGWGDADIFYCERLDDTWNNWSAPVNLGNKINSNKFDAYFSMHDSVAYFCSNRASRFADIYRASLHTGADSLKRKIKEIVAEAQAILLDLHGGAPDSSLKVSDLGSVFVDFEYNSEVISPPSVNRLNTLVEKFMPNRRTTSCGTGVWKL
jgi:hypothetical protein